MTNYDGQIIWKMIHHDYLDYSYKNEYYYKDFEPIYDSLTNQIITTPIHYYSLQAQKEVTNFLSVREIVIKSEGKYCKDLKEGLWKIYYDDGTVSALLRFKSGYPVDTIYFYDRLGAITAKIIPMSEWKFLDCRMDSTGSFNKCKITSKEDYLIIFD